LSAYCDSDWAGSPDDRQSTSGFAIFLGNCLVSWSAKKQAVVSRSSTEAEYRSLAITTAELFWLCMLFKDLGVSLPTTPVLWCDNISALALTSNPIFHARTKHIEVDYHFIQDKVVNRDIVIKFINSSDQLANIFTKGLSSAQFLFLKSKLMVVPHISLRGVVKICDPSATIDATIDANVQDQAYREATTQAQDAVQATNQVQDAVQDITLLNQVNHVGSTASLANIHCRAETNMASGDLIAASYVTKERRTEANNTRKGNITPFNHDRS
jgi:hypothetical protein